MSNLRGSQETIAAMKTYTNIAQYHDEVVSKLEKALEIADPEKATQTIYAAMKERFTIQDERIAAQDKKILKLELTMEALQGTLSKTKVLAT